MGFKVSLTPQSQEDLRGIVSFIARHHPVRAKSFGHELIDRALALAELPERGRMVPEISEPSVREIIHGS
jgi:toxin ParE1/3/4